MHLASSNSVDAPTRMIEHSFTETSLRKDMLQTQAQEGRLISRILFNTTH